MRPKKALFSPVVQIFGGGGGGGGEEVGAKKSQILQTLPK